MRLKAFLVSLSLAALIGCDHLAVKVKPPPITVIDKDAIINSAFNSTVTVTYTDEF